LLASSLKDAYESNRMFGRFSQLQNLSETLPLAGTRYVEMVAVESWLGDEAAME